jgi:phthalate 4,5-cis-dihydrodiol dehydrogenase
MVLRVGIAGFGGAARQILPAFKEVPEVELTAVADVRYDTLEVFRARGVKTFDSAEAMFESPDVDAVWISTPNDLHMAHTIQAATSGKHIIGEKPMALTLDQAQAMLQAVERNGVTYVQGHSQMYNPPVQKMRELIASGRLGRVFAINNWRYQNWLNKPRLATEVDTGTGGGVVYRQGPHHVDIVRCLGSGMVRSVRAVTGRWSPHFPNTEGNYSAFLEFADRTAATLILSGYARFDSAELVEGADVAARARKADRITQPLTWEEKYSLPEYTESVEAGERMRGGHDYYGLTIVSGERADMRDGPNGIYLYDDEGRHEVLCEPKGVAHVHELRELHQAVRQRRPAFPDARWGMATLEVILAIMRSSNEGREVFLEHQIPYVDRPN